MLYLTLWTKPMQKESLKSQIDSPTTLQSTPLKLPEVKLVIELKLD